MKILPVLRPLQGKGFDTDTLVSMSCNALCLQRMRNGTDAPPVDPNAIAHTFFGDENDTIQNFFLTRGEVMQNNLSVLIASDGFLRRRAHQIDFDEQYGALPCLGDVLRGDINDHKQFLLDGADQLMANGAVPAKRMSDFALLTSPLTWKSPQIETDKAIETDGETEETSPPAPAP